MTWELQEGEGGAVRFKLAGPRKGAWTHTSVDSVPPEYAPVFTNWDLPGGIPTTMYGNADFISTAWTSGFGTVVNGLFEFRIIGSSPKIILFTASGYAAQWDG